MEPVKMRREVLSGSSARGLEPWLVEVVYEAGAATGSVAVECEPASLCDVLRDRLGDDVDGERRCIAFGLASSLGTFGPPAREHGTPCLTQFAHGDSSLHCECEGTLISFSRSSVVAITSTPSDVPTYLDMSPLALRATLPRLLVTDPRCSDRMLTTALHRQHSLHRSNGQHRSFSQVAASPARLYTPSVDPHNDEVCQPEPTPADEMNPSTTQPPKPRAMQRRMTLSNPTKRRMLIHTRSKKARNTESNQILKTNIPLEKNPSRNDSPSPTHQPGRRRSTTPC